MKILIFSWRDIRHPKSGGAETVTHELARRWVNLGHKVTLLSARFPGSRNSQITDGVKIIRCADFYRYSSLQYLIFLFKTIRYYRQCLSGKYDLVIDQVHGLPFFTVFYVKEKVILFPLEVAGKIWQYEIPFPFNLIGQLLEYAYFRLYSRFPAITISESVKKELMTNGLKQVKIIPLGNSIKTLNNISKKNKYPTIISLGRIVPMKRLENTIKAFALVLKQYPASKLYIVGQGKQSYIQQLKQFAASLHIGLSIIWCGYVSEKIKFDDYSQTMMPKNIDDLAYYSLGQLAHLIKRKKITSTELFPFF